MHLLKKRTCIWVLGALATLIFFMRFLVFQEPPSRDITTYSAIADAMLHGMRLYADVWDPKPPAIYWTYVLAQQIAGYGARSLLLLSVVASTITMAGLIVAGGRGRCRVSGLMAAATFAVISGDLFLWGNEPNAEIFMNAALVWAFVFVSEIPNRTGRSALIRAAAAGVLITVASLYKTVVVVHAVAFGGLLLMHGWRNSAIKSAIKNTSTMAFVAVIPWLCVFAGYALRGTFADFYESVFTYNTYYSGMTGGMGPNIIRGFTPENLFPRPLWCTAPLLLMGAAGWAALRFRGSYRTMLLLVYLLASQVAIALPGQFYVHYYQLLLPPLCIAGAWGFEALAEKLQTPIKIALLGAGLMVILFSFELPLYSLSPESWAAAKYGTDLMEEHETGRLINSILLPDEDFYQWGTVTALHWSSRRRPVTPYFFLTPLLDGPLKEKAMTRLLQDLEKQKTELLIIDERDARVSPGHPLSKWHSGRYRKFALIKNRFVFLCRKGGALDERMRTRGM